MNQIILGPLVVAGSAAFLSLVIALVDRVVNNYGEVTIDINHGKKQFKVTGGSKLLSTLASQELFVPSACGGRGSCGACKVRVLSDVGPVLPTETPYLSPEELSNNVRLSCQVKLKKDSHRAARGAVQRKEILSHRREHQGSYIRYQGNCFQAQRSKGDRVCKRTIRTDSRTAL